ncbi:hypothetical protein LSAT2_014838 [Lamellibrachia satsuma]|nr:hypothetical protein LSAT2_014838 [Lamellibrachia satsuma]
MASNRTAGLAFSKTFSHEFLSCALTLLCICLCNCANPKEEEEYLICHQCGHDITPASQLRGIPSKLALAQRNDTVLGIEGLLIQLFQNPQGARFEVITSARANVFKADQKYAEHSFFPGFTWQISVCPRCGYHLGWFFESRNDKHTTDECPGSLLSFVGLILGRLVHKDYVDSLLITPKAYRS